jgi:hypothetical protein
MIAGDEIVKFEKYKIERFVALGLGRYDAIKAVEAGIDWHTVESLVTEKGCPVSIALEIARWPNRVRRIAALSRRAGLGTLRLVTVAIGVVLSVVALLSAGVVIAMFVWAAKKDGDEDRAVQRRLGIRRRTRIGR